MGILSWFNLGRGRGVPVNYEPTYMFTPDDVRNFVSGMASTPAKIYETQDQVRTVLDFRARNFSQIGMHVYRTNDDGGRDRDRTSNTARLLRAPNPGMTWMELMWALCLDFDLHFETYLLYGGGTVVHIPKSRVTLEKGSWVLGDFVARVDPLKEGGQPIRVTAENLIPFHLWNPVRSGGLTPMESLKQTIEEQVEARAYRLWKWKKSGQYVHRPIDAPDWNPEDRNRFVESMRKYLVNRPGGGSPLMEDGMEIRENSLKASDEQFVEASKLSRETVAAAYGVTLSMLGSSDGVTYGNMKEYRRMLYGETLGPMFKMVEQRLNAFLLPKVDPGDTDLYLEFNLKERLRADPLDQARVYQASVGAPIMTRNEARARENLPAVDDGDELITPLNVVTGAIANPQDTAPEDNTEQLSLDPNRMHSMGAKRVSTMRRSQVRVEHRNADVDSVAGVLRTFFERQRRAVVSAAGAGSLEFDYDRWNDELFSDLQQVMPGITAAHTRRILSELDLTEDVFNARIASSIEAQMSDHVGNITTTTARKLMLEDANEVFDELVERRSAQYADTIVASSHNRRAMDVAKQGAKAAGGEAMKTWITTSGDSRPEHAAMNGQTVKVKDPFSNGAMFPRSSVLGAAGVANCQCITSITIQRPLSE
ncbi:MAG: phage portal protein [Micrococcaceae bacterium]